MTTKRERTVRALIEKAGLTCDGLEKGGTGHFRATLRNKANEIMRATFSLTPSDRRGDLNQLSIMRRFARREQQ